MTWLILGIILVAAWRKDPLPVYFLAFLGGVFADLLTGRLLGTSAIYFLLAAGAVTLWKKRPF